MPVEPSAQQYILLPSRGLRATTLTSSLASRNFLLRMHALLPSSEAFPEVPGTSMRVVDSIREDGAKLVEMPPESALVLRTYQPGLTLVPIIYFRPAVARRPLPVARPKATVAAASRSTSMTLQVIAKQDGTPIPGATVIAFTDFGSRIGALGKTNNSGQVRLALGATSRKLERLYVYPERGFWSRVHKNITIATGTRIKLDPVALGYTDALRHFYGNSPDDAGTGITVGVIDTGIDLAHPDLVVDGGENTVVGEQANDYGDNGAHHGTHVAGIIAARGIPPKGLRGLAPGVRLRGYRVFGKQIGDEEALASNYSIAKAIDRAVEQGCDLITMSLGGPDPDDATRAAIADARAQGVLVIAAAGNDDRGPVAYPAAFPLCIGVSAMGRKGTFPPASTQHGDVALPFGADKKDFVAAFSNVGPEIDVTGPGVGILSTVPGGYTPMDGTSMACPAVTGFAAKLLARKPEILSMPRTEDRSDAMATALLVAARSLGFGAPFEGHGLPR